MARQYLESDAIADTPVQFLGEIQILLSKYCIVRHQMHEPYKVARAVDARQLYDDYLRTTTNRDELETRADVDQTTVLMAAYVNPAMYSSNIFTTCCPKELDPVF